MQLGRIAVRVADRAPVDQPPGHQPERVDARGHGVRGQHQPRPRVGGLEHAAEPIEDRRQPAGAAPQPAGALEPLLRGRVAHLSLDVGDQPGAAGSGADEHPQRLVQPPAVQVRVEVTQARRQAAAHLPVRGGVVAARELAAAVAQAEQRVELLDELEREPPAAQRTDRDRVSRRRLARTTSRIGNGMSSRQRM